jgi:DNA polymerase
MKLKNIYSQIITELKNTLENYDCNDFNYIKNQEKFNYTLNDSIKSKIINKKEENSFNENNFDKESQEYRVKNRENLDKKIKNSNSDISVNERLLITKKRVNSCKNCNLHLRKNSYVFGEGSLNADIMFIGEGPGEQEDKTGIPFIGPAGNLLTSIIKNGMKIDRKDVYITNIVKCRPPGNRNPLEIEIFNCINYLYEEIKIVNPKVIVALGSVALRSLLPHYSGITKYRGSLLTLVLDNGSKYSLIPTFHPSYLLRGSENEQKRKKQEVWQDIKKVMDLVGLPY